MPAPNTTTTTAAAPAPLILDDATDIPKAAHNLSFPPFPHLQSNIPIIPFADFVPKGTQIKDDDDDDTTPELDAEGVPTIMLNVIHDLDKSSKKGKKGKLSKSKTREDGTPKPWHEQWADNEILMRAERLDPSRFTPYECVVQADIDFQHRRFLPIPVRNLYDEMRVYLGIIEGIEKRKPFALRRPQQSQTAATTPEAIAAETPGDEADEEFLSDDDLDVEDDDAGLTKTRATSSSLVPHAPAAKNTTIGEEDDYDGTLAPFAEHSDLPSAHRFEQFITDPVLAIKVFLSSEYMNRGLYWLEWNLYAGPVVVSAFLEFIIRHELLSSEHIGPMKEAAEWARKAREELPATIRASKVLRDGWGTVCSDIWGSREEILFGIPGLDTSTWPFSDIDEGYNTEHSTDAPVPVLALENDIPVDIPFAPHEPLAAVVDISNKPSNDSLRTIVTPEVEVVVAASRWDSSSSTDAPLGANVETDGPLLSASDFAKPSLATWDDELAPPPTMFTYVGCASFPLTHSPVRAERSVREILAVNPPMDIFASRPSNPVSLLHSKLGSVVLGPWKGKTKQGGDVPPPEMLEMETSSSSSSPSIIPTASANLDGNDSSENAVPPFASQFFRPGEVGESHDCTKDIITVLVAPEIISKLTVGLGVHGIFVQVARRLDAPTFPAIKDGNSPALAGASAGAGAGAGGKGKWSKGGAGGGGGNRLPPHYPNDGRSWWYIDSVSQVIPSFWAEASELPAIETLAL